MKGLGFYGENFLVFKSDKNLIRENIIRILLTSPGERVMSNFGSRLKDFLFEPENILAQEVEGEIRKAISLWEPRVEIINIFISEVEKNTVRLKLDCLIKETLEDLNLDTIIRL
jgi:phage baseplate assembly protein W